MDDHLSFESRNKMSNSDQTGMIQRAAYIFYPWDPVKEDNEMDNNTSLNLSETPKEGEILDSRNVFISLLNIVSRCSEAFLATMVSLRNSKSTPIPAGFARML